MQSTSTASRAFSVVIEPDQGGQAVLDWLALSAIRERVLLVRLGEHKDPSALHIANPDGFEATFGQALLAAETWANREAVVQEAARAAAWKQCAELAYCDRLLERFSADLAATGFAGETAAARIVYLAVTSRLLKAADERCRQRPVGWRKVLSGSLRTRLLPRERVLRTDGDVGARACLRRGALSRTGCW